MIIKPNHAFIGMPTTATIELFSGDHVSIAYKKPNGEYNIINVSAQHWVFMAVHEQTDAAVLVRSDKVQVLNPKE